MGAPRSREATADEGLRMIDLWPIAATAIMGVLLVIIVRLSWQDGRETGYVAGYGDAVEAVRFARQVRSKAYPDRPAVRFDPDPLYIEAEERAAWGDR